MQTITIVGRIGKDAETRSAGGNDVTSFNIAVDQGYGDRKRTNWYRVNVWGKKGTGAAPYLLKGGQVTVSGDLEIGEYEGKPQYQVNASNFTLPMKGGDKPTERSKQAAPPLADDFDDIPF